MQLAAHLDRQLHKSRRNFNLKLSKMKFAKNFLTWVSWKVVERQLYLYWDIEIYRIRMRSKQPCCEWKFHGKIRHCHTNSSIYFNNDILQLLFITTCYLAYRRNRRKDFNCHWCRVADIGFYRVPGPWNKSFSRFLNAFSIQILSPVMLKPLKPGSLTNEVKL